LVLRVEKEEAIDETVVWLSKAVQTQPGRNAFVSTLNRNSKVPI
jgi:hypothetical protein